MKKPKSDIEALQLWLDFVKTGEWCCTHLESDYNYVWYVKIIPGHGLNKYMEGDNHEPVVYLSGEKLKDVIYRAIKRALDWKKNVLAKKPL